MKQETIDRIRQFSKDRDWDQFHTPVNLAKSIVIEAGELLECYQWQDEANLEHVKEELADVIVYCRNMLDALGLDEDEIVNAKMDRNEKKYPVDKAYGSNKKYTEFQKHRQQNSCRFPVADIKPSQRKKRICDQKPAATVQNMV